MALGHHRARLALLLALAVSVPLLPAAAEDEHHAAAARAIVDDGINLIVPEGESYNLSGYHGYTGEVIINGTLKVDPWDGVNEPSGMLNITAASIFIGPSGGIFADGRGYGGGGGGGPFIPASFGKGGIGGMGGDGGTPSGSGGGGGSNGGAGGSGWWVGGWGSNGTEAGGGDGGSGQVYKGGAGGAGFGGGGGGGALNSSYMDGGGGGGGGGTGGKDGDMRGNGGNGSGPFGGLGALATQGFTGGAGGYLEPQANGDNSTDWSASRGSGGGGGAAPNAGGAGGGGAGGGMVFLFAERQLSIEGRVTTAGASGGYGGMDGVNGGSNGGGGAGGGILLRGFDISVAGIVDARGCFFGVQSMVNGGTVKIFYFGNFNVTGNVSAGRIYKKSIPAMHGLVWPPDNAWALPKPVFSWNPASSPDGDPVVYEFIIYKELGKEIFERVLDIANIVDTSLAITTPLPGGDLRWMVRASDSLSVSNWSEQRTVRVDSDLPDSRVNSLPGYVRSADFTVSWAGSDRYSGVTNYSIYVSENGRNFIPWLVGTDKTSAAYAGRDGYFIRFYSIATDSVGNRETAPAGPDAATTVDLSPPRSSVLHLEPHQGSADISVKWTAADNTSGVSYIDIYASVDGGPFSVWLENMTLDVPSAVYHGAEGHEYSFYSLARDVAGNVEAVPGPEYIRTTKVDGTRPMTVFAPGEPNYGSDPIYVAPNTTLYLNATDNFVGVNKTFYVIDARATKEYSGGFNELQAGAHNITYWSVDEAGNTEAQRTAWFFVDNQAPVTQLLFEGGNAVAGNVQFIGPETQLRLAGLDNGSGLDRTLVDVDGAGWRTYDGPFNLSSAGEHTIRFMSVDNLGQEESARTVKVTVDATTPETTATADSNLSNKDIHIAFSGLDNESGLAGIFHRVVKAGGEAPAFQAGNGTTVRAAADRSLDGSYTVEYYSVDRVGNAGPVQRISVAIDTVLELSVNWGTGVSVSGGAFPFYGKAEPGATVLVNGKPVPVMSDGGFSARVNLKEGRNRIVVNATDPAGNSAEQARYVTYTKPASTDALLAIVVLVAIVTSTAGVLFLFRRPRKRQDVPMVESVESRLERKRSKPGRR